MVSSRRVIQRSLLTSQTPELEQRRRDSLRAIDNPMKRAAALLLHNLAVHAPTTAARYAGLDLDELNGAQFIGMGTDSLVVRQDENVVKVHLRSIDLRGSALDKFADNKRASHRSMAKYLGEFMLPQEVAPGLFPGSEQLTTVNTTQAFRHINDPGLFPRTGHATNVNVLHEMVDQNTYIRDYLKAFVHKSFELYRHTGLLPDTLGVGNIDYDSVTGHLALVDGYPIPRANTASQHRGLSQLHSLEDLLASV